MDPSPGAPGAASAGEARKQTSAVSASREESRAQTSPGQWHGEQCGRLTDRGTGLNLRMARAHQEKGRKGTVGKGMTCMRARKHEQAV